jgi:hypothetical protein
MKSLVTKLWTSEAAGIGLAASLMLLLDTLVSHKPIDVSTILLPLATGLGVGAGRPTPQPQA